MRKPLVIILLLLVASAGFVGYGAAEIYKTNNQVEITEEIIFGDSQAADGLETTFRTTYADHSFWTTTQTVGSGRPPETEYEFFRKARPMKYRYNNYGINYYLNYLPDSFFYDYEEDPEATACFGVGSMCDFIVYGSHSQCKLVGRPLRRKQQ